MVAGIGQPLDPERNCRDCLAPLIAGEVVLCDHCTAVADEDYPHVGEVDPIGYVLDVWTDE